MFSNFLTAAQCSFYEQMLTEHKEIVDLLGTIISGRLIHILCFREYFQQQDGQQQRYKKMHQATYFKIVALAVFHNRIVTGLVFSKVNFYDVQRADVFIG